MKFPVCLVAAFVAMLMHSTSSKTLDVRAQGYDDEKERIIDGKPAAEGQFPWTAVLFLNGQFICTSSIISPRTILTAAHCVVQDGVTGSASSFNALANYRKSADDVFIEIESITPHPDYTGTGDFQNDIAVLTTREDIPFSDTVKPICIARKDTPAMEYRNATAMGWGNTQRRPFRNLPDELQYVEQNIVPNFFCSIKYFFMPVEETKICAGFFNGICNGDSGGPLVHLSADKPPVEIGIASYINNVFGCGFLAPGVFTRVSSYYDFIIDTAADKSAICEV